MMRRTPMKPGKGFRMRDYQAAPPAPPTRGRMASMGPAELTVRPRAPKPIRSEEYRRLVAALPCYYCGLEGQSQAAHPNSDKSKGAKLSDLDCFPLCCDRPGIKGHHSQFDQYELVPKGEAMRAFEQAAKEWTQREINRRT